MPHWVQARTAHVIDMCSAVDVVLSYFVMVLASSTCAHTNNLEGVIAWAVVVLYDMHTDRLASVLLFLIPATTLSLMLYFPALQAR
jgi:hypothetical protein